MAIHHKNQHGLATVYILSFIVMLWLVITFACFGLYSFWQSTEHEITKNMLNNKQLKQSQTELNTRLHQVQSLVGFYEKGLEEIQDTTQVKTNVRDLIDNLNKMNHFEGKDRGTRHYYGLSQLEYSPDIEEEKLSNLDYPINVEKVLGAFEARILQLQRDITSVEEAINAVVMEKKSKVSEREQLVQKLNGITADLEQKHNALKSKFANQLEEVNRQKKDAEDAKTKAQEEMKKIEKELQAQKIDIKNKIDQKKSEIRKLQAAKYGRTTYSEIVKQREFNPNEEKEDGSVVFADPRARTVYINLGTQHNVKHGLKLDVYRPGQKGTRELKGQVEVQKVMDNVSMATIIDQNAMDPIVGGDLIVNPIFQERSPIYIAIAGSFLAHSNEQAKRMIEEVGGVVEAEVTAKTNFVIIGDKKSDDKKGEDSPNYQAAIRFGIPLMTEKLLLRYIGD